AGDDRCHEVLHERRGVEHPTGDEERDRTWNHDPVGQQPGLEVDRGEPDKRGGGNRLDDAPAVDAVPREDAGRNRESDDERLDPAARTDRRVSSGTRHDRWILGNREVANGQDIPEHPATTHERATADRLVTSGPWHVATTRRLR